MSRSATMKGNEESHQCSTTSVTTGIKRRAVTSLSPAKERHMLSNIPTKIFSSQLRPPLTSSRGAHKTKSSNLASGSRPLTKPPPLPRNSIAVSQEETCLVSAAGDVLVCRSREFSQLMAMGSLQQYGGLSASTSNQKNNGSVGWCEMECSDLPMTLEKSALCNPWMTRLNSQREEKKDDDSAAAANYALSGGLRGGSTYEWEARPADPVEQASRALGALDLELEVVNSTSNMGSDPASPLRDDAMSYEGDDEDRVVSMPSFDYSHFGNGGNDMVPTSPARNRQRLQVDVAEIDVNLGFKRPQTALHSTRELSRVLSAPFPQRKATSAAVTCAPPLFHGVPTFLPSLLQVRIQQVSAHPRGSHVLMISAEALLFSYGLNDHGQLGIGIKSPATGQGNELGDRYVWTPTIITPLLENGGKAIACAAGESHSLVVVSTEGRRVMKSQSPKVENGTSVIQMSRVSSSPPGIDTNRERRGDESEHSTSSASGAAESVWHHQLYGFGRNNFMKIGLIHPRRKGSTEQQMSPEPPPSASEANLAIESHHDDLEDVLLPHRVALHCTVWPEKGGHEESQKSGSCSGMALSKLPPQGIFALSASSEHSAALVRRATGDIELYTWGNAAYHALGLSQEKLSKLKANKICPVPTLVEELSCFSKEVSPKPTKQLLDSDPPESPIDVSLGPYSTFVVTSKGRCFSFGISYDGMLGHGRNVTEVKEPNAISFPGTSHVVSVSAGTGHVMALADCGRVYTWGKNTDGRLGLGDNHASTASENSTDMERTMEWTPQELPPPSRMATLYGFPPTASGRRPPAAAPADVGYGPVVQVCAGLDCSIFVTSCGQVLSCGKQSGRLGLGELEKDVHSPTSLFGGLRLWYRPVARPPRKASPSPAKNRPVLKRGLTLPG